VSLLTRLATLERVTPGGTCPVCRGNPPSSVRYFDDGAQLVGEGVERDPCPGCGGLTVYAVTYVDMAGVGRAG
jgi:hypothetical protein